MDVFLKYPKFIKKVRQTSLGSLIGKNDTKKISGDKLNIQITPLNKKQMESVNSALTKDITVVTGPPGTGKISSCHQHTCQLHYEKGKCSLCQ